MLEIRDTVINATEGYEVDRSGWCQAFTDDKGELFRSLQKEYGLCVSRIYADVPLSDAEHLPAPAMPIEERRQYRSQPCGWIFGKRVQYQDSPGTYRQEVEVKVREQ